MRVSHRLASAALAVAFAAGGIGSAALTAGASPTTAHVTVVHGIPNTPVTVYANGAVLIKDFKFGNVVGPVDLRPGKYNLAVRPHGASATSSPILSDTVKVVAGENATVVANLTTSGKPTLNVFANPTSAIPMGDARVIVRHVAQAPAVDVYATTSATASLPTTPLISDLANPGSATANVTAGTYYVSVYAHGTTAKPVIGPAKFSFAAGDTYIVYAIGSATAKPATLTVAVQKY